MSGGINEATGYKLIVRKYQIRIWKGIPSNIEILKLQKRKNISDCRNIFR